MSSNNHRQCSSDEPIYGGSMTESTENQEIKVCFICGTHTTLIINIHEPRCGPNMIDVISEKFKMRPLNDDKFLCYSCNNWLINWYSMQKKSDDSSHEDAQETTSSTMSAAITSNAHEQTATKTSDDDRHYDANELVIISDEEDVENVDVNNIVQTLRSRLKKYLYRPNRQKCNDPYELQAHPQPTLIELNETTDIQQNCERCGKLVRRHSNRHKQRTLCRSCRFLIRRYGKCSAQLKIHTNHLKRSQYQPKTHISPLIDKQSDTLKFNHHINIFEKLQQLGTSIYYENECRNEQHQNQRHMTSIPREIHTNEMKNELNEWKRRTNESNEILMTFNTVVTEVFPIEELYNKCYDRQDDQMSNGTADNNGLANINIQEILRNVPKSLSITIT